MHNLHKKIMCVIYTIRKLYWVKNRSTICVTKQKYSVKH